MDRSFIIKLFLLMMTTNLASSDDVLAQGQKGKMYFSTQPFSNGHDANKNDFTSRDFIYGRIETNQPLKDAFNMSSIKTEYNYLQATYRIIRVEDNREKYMQQSLYIRIDNGVENNTAFNFDILPAADKAKTTISLLEDFSTGQCAGIFTPFLSNNDYFWKNGEYKVAVSIYLKSYNAYGTLDDTEKWPDITGEFTFHFDMNDVAAQIKNSQAADASVKENSLRMDKLPDYFSSPAKISDPELTSARIMAILKRDLSSVNITKVVIPPFDGTLKDIAKNEFGVILYRYVRPYVRVIYKENGKCYLGSVSLKEDYAGGGKYGPLKLNKFWGTEGLLDCSLVK
ncbi:MAG TPA: hypothetical protein VFZ42_11755 [Chitinophagaceae bacterium]